MNLYHFTLSTSKEGFFNITSQVNDALAASKVKNGICVVFSPHTTAGITINENADPNVVSDMLLGLKQAYPENSNFKHSEGNSTAHLKATAVGSSATVIIDNGKLLLGIWQGIYFCEFDGPRTRNFYVKIL